MVACLVTLLKSSKPHTLAAAYLVEIMLETWSKIFRSSNGDGNCVEFYNHKRRKRLGFNGKYNILDQQYNNAVCGKKEPMLADLLLLTCYGRCVYAAVTERNCALIWVGSLQCHLWPGHSSAKWPFSHLPTYWHLGTVEPSPCPWPVKILFYLFR